jgi:serine/threonine protein kinase
LTELKRQLLDLQIVSESTWQEALDAVGAGAGPMATLRVIDRLRTTTATTHTGATTLPILTAYQAEQLLTGNAGRLRFRHYVILDRLGAGGMGEVFMIRNLNLDRLEAMKTVLRASTKAALDAQTAAQARFKREAQLLARLNHPNITTIYDAGREGDVDFITMEFVAGEDLRTIVKKSLADGRPMPVRWACAQIAAAANALHHAHAAGIVHRDIKPSNLMLTRDGVLKVLDMGIARLWGGTQPTATSLTQQAHGLGTPDVMPPEQWLDAAAVTPAADVYSLGCTFYYLLTGEMPFKGDSVGKLMYAHLEQPPPKPSERRADVPGTIDEVIAKMLAKRPEERFSSAAEVAETLRPFFEDRPAPGRTSRRGFVVSAIAAVLLFAAVGTIWSGRRPWLPEGYSAAPEARKQLIDGDYYFDRIRHAEYPELVLLLVPRQRPEDPPTYYIAENKVTNETFARFAAASPDVVTTSQWQLGGLPEGSAPAGEHPRHPVLRVTVAEADACARWLGGRLPTTKQWDKAAGLFDAAGAAGPFTGTWDGSSVEGFALGRGAAGPMEVGTAERDRSPFGCRDMTGNGREWTRDVAGLERRTVPLPNPTEFDRVWLRGRSYFRDAPLLYEQLADPSLEEIESQPYLEADPQTGFRIVIER